MKRMTKILAISIAAAIGLGSAGFAMAKGDGGMGHRGMGKMGETAIAACTNQAEGAGVTFEHPMWGNVSAVCAKAPNGKIVAMPAKMVAHMQESKAACEGKKEGDKVSISNMMDASKKIDATCKQHGDVLAAHPEHKGMGKDGMKGHRDHGMKGDMPPPAAPM